MDRKNLLERLRRIEGQVRGVQRMVEEDQYCLDILTQLSALTAAVKAVGLGLLDDHVRYCVKESIERGEEDVYVKELMAAVARLAGR
jgi:DNA-binding FrmR family transcriptional regulator